MKKNYTNPEVNVSYFITENIITMSGEAAQSLMTNTVETKLNSYSGEKAPKVYKFVW